LLAHLDLIRFLKGDRIHCTSSSVQCHSRRIKLLEYGAKPLSTGAGVLLCGRVGRPVSGLASAGDPVIMGCGLRKLEDPEDSSPGKIYSTLKRPQVETKTDSVYEYVLLDFSLEGNVTELFSKQKCGCAVRLQKKCHGIVSTKILTLFLI